VSRVLPESTRARSLHKAYARAPLAGRTAVLASGGLDSAVLLAESARAHQSVYPVYVKTGMIWEREEIRAFSRFSAALGLKKIQPLAVLRLPMDDLISDHWSITGHRVPGYRSALSSNYIPGRNLSLISKAAIFCALNRIGSLAIATLQANPFPDAQPEFFDALANAVAIGIGLKLKVHAPYLGLTKADLIRRMSYLPFELTVSCIRPRGIIHCGACTKCAERIEAFRAAGVPDPTRYAKRQP
jgi:7-cyano-7-deazaguanine synthase